MKYSGTKVMLKLIGLVKPLMSHMSMAILMGLVGHLCATLIPVLGVYMVLTILGVSQLVSMQMIVFGILLCAILRGVLRYLEQSFNHYIAFKLLAEIRSQVFEVLRKLAPAKLEGKDKGNLISIITSDIELLEVFYAHTISPAMIALLYGMILCGFMAHFHILLAMIALVGYVMIGLLLPCIISKWNQKTEGQFREQSGNLSSFIHDSLRGLFEIIQFQYGQKRLSELDAKTDQLSNIEKDMRQITGFNMAISQTLIWTFDIVMLVVGVYLYQQDSISFIGVVISVVAFMSSFGPFVALANLSSTLQNTFASGNRVLNLLEETPVVSEVSGKPSCEFDDMSVENVSFAYDQEMILSNVSLDICRDSIVGIIGQSGSGKSTLLKLLMRFWDVSKGNIKIGDTILSDVNTTDLRNAQSYMTQDTHLFKDTIRNNLKIANLHASQQEIEIACKKASIHDFIMSLPSGYDTQVGELGDTLSGGERQRMGLARAFLHQAPCMLLDEPTSNLDSLNEAIILQSLYKERQNKAIVLVSHRESTMKIADVQITMNQGRMS